MKRGFTLVEILVVVIVIAILATIAMPQFFKVAERGRAAEGVSALGALRAAQMRYYTEHQGNYADDCSDLDVDIGTLKYFAAPACAGTSGNLASVTRSGSADYGAYTLTINEDGDITCAGGTKCPAGF